MKEHITGAYLKIQPVKYDSFVSPEKETYEMVGVVLGRGWRSFIPLGAKVWFDSFMAKKYPVPGKEDEYEYFIHRSEVVKYETDE